MMGKLAIDCAAWSGVMALDDELVFGSSVGTLLDQPKSWIGLWFTVGGLKPAALELMGVAAAEEPKALDEAPVDDPPFPNTSRVKSSSPTPLPAGEKGPSLGRAIRSVGAEDVANSLVLPDSAAKARNLRVCSDSMRPEVVLMSSMNCVNCAMLSSGPNANAHRMGSTSVARKSASAICPICLNAARAAIMTAGSFVFMAFMSGTIFSWTVYLSRIADLAPDDESSSVSFSLDPPQRITNASRPRTLMARLLVRENTAATTGKSSFLMVE